MQKVEIEPFKLIGIAVRTTNEGQKANRLVPNVYYLDIKDGLKLFIDCFEFSIGHEELKSENPFCVIEKGELQMYLFEQKELAKEHTAGQPGMYHYSAMVKR